VGAATSGGFLNMMNSYPEPEIWKIPGFSSAVGRPTDVEVKVKVNLVICKAPFNYQLHFLKRSDMTTHSFTCKQSIPAFTPSHRASSLFGW